MNNIFFTADLHFRHHLMLKIRSFDNIDEMNETIIDNYNSIITNKSCVWFLGDIGFGKFSEIEKLIKRLNGQKNLILGNHDERYKKDYIKSGLFQSVSYFKQIKINKQRISLMHYPMHSWAASHYGSWHLHGHCHSNIDDLNNELINKGINRYDVGIDGNNYKPVSIDQLDELFNKKEKEI